MEIVAAVFITAGVLLTLIGYIIKKTKNIELLSQYNSKKNYDRDELAKFAGNNFIAMGLMVMFASIAALIAYILTKSDIALVASIFVFLATVLYFSFKVALGVDKFSK